ncbi:universal stress protein [Aureispira anguillae]|uniref:Universal stress protein n=1 Tax=Aureispira anguillae TaxID=2864201 RepID=A0A915YCD2_9BACT|nr:universal stress protein [Aureispira anguillae]BDS10477.1 universal stress protein [Aureispira anguillae]
MKNILTATDFSITANKAIDYALMIAKGQRTSVGLKLLNVYHISEELAPIISEQHIKKLSRHELFDITLYKHLQDLPQNIDLEGVIRKGPIVPTILQEAKEGKADFIVLGRNGHSGIKDWLIGSTTTQLINKSEVPVIVIPKMAAVKPPKKIALAIDDRFVPSHETLAPLYDMVDRFNTELILFHVEQETPHSNTHKETAIQIARKGYQINLYKMDSEHTGDALIALAEQHQVDLLCIIKHDYTAWERMLHKSTTTSVASNSPLPFMILHDKL